MRDHNNARDGRPSLTWVPAVDARGRRFMEARWTLATAVGTAAIPVGHRAA